jgi:hypothetical protein
MTVYVISTMTNSVNYCFYKNVGDLPVMRDKILVHGGANMPSLKSGFGDMNRDGEGHPMWTAAGMVTPLSDERYDVLKEHWLFKKHQDSGWVKVVNKDIIGNHNAVKKEVATMEKTDGFAQMTPATLKQKIKVKTGQTEMDAESQFRL